MTDALKIFNLLIVEDSPTAIEVIKEGAAKVPFPIRFISCQTGVEAETFLDKCANLPPDPDDLGDIVRPDLVVLDMEIPEPHGIKILEKIKSNEQLKFIPVLVNTSSQDFQYMIKANAYSGVFYQRKSLGNGEKIFELAVKIRNKHV